jgi:mannose-6-phosphate isomerase-like protein (cupin superfamily)
MSDVHHRPGRRPDHQPEHQLTPSESVRITEHTAEALVVEGTWGPGGTPPPKHFHPAQDEHFEVLEGELHARVDGEERVLSAGDVLDVPRQTPHQIWNPGTEPARASWRTSPAGRTADWFADLAALRGSGRVGGNGMPGPLAFGAYLTEYRDVFRLAGPQPLVLGALRLLGAVGRLRGYRPATPEPQTAAPGRRA